MVSSTESIGWRQTYVILGAGTIAIMTPIGFLFYRSKPEDYGMLPDAEVPHGAGLNLGAHFFPRMALPSAVHP